MRKFRLLFAMVLAAAVSFTACEPKGGEEVAVPTVAVTLDEASVTADSFSVSVVTANAEKASWLVAAHGEEGVTAAVVFETGTAIPAESLNVAETPAVVAVTGLTAKTEYDLYVAVENKGKQTLSEVVCVTTAAPAAQVVEFSADATVGNGACEMSMSLMEAGGKPGQYLMLANADWDVAQLMMLDYDFAQFGCESYSYLTGHHYPLAAGSFNEMTFPTVSCLMVDPGYTNFTIGEVTYYPIVPESATDADGNPYGVTVTTMVPQGQDLNLLDFNVPAVKEVDDAGNPVGEVVIIKGQYMGPLQYVLTKPSAEFSLEDRGFLEFEGTQEGSIVTLISRSVVNGDFKMILDLSDYEGVMASEEGVLYLAGEETNLSGYFWDSFDDITYNFTEGGFMLFSTDKKDTFTLEVGRARGWKMEGPSFAYDITPGTYTIKVSGLGGSNSTEGVGKDDEQNIIL